MDPAGRRPAADVDGDSLEDGDHRDTDREQAVGFEEVFEILGNIRNDPEDHRGDGHADERKAQEVMEPGCRACRQPRDAVLSRRSGGNDRDQEKKTEDSQVRVRPPRPQGRQEERGGNPGGNYPDDERCIRGVPADRPAGRFR